MRYASRFLVVAGAASLLAGCLGLQLTNIKATEQKPSNVAVYFKVSDSKGAPLQGLTVDRFRIYEDDQLVSQVESKQTLLSSDTMSVHYTLVLVDVSGVLTENGTSDALAHAVSAFADRVGKDHLGIYAFDGSADLHPIAPFATTPDAVKGSAQDLATFKAKDPSTNLNGAIVKALDELDAAVGRAAQPLKFGSLVVFTGGPDRANRVTTADMLQHIREKPFDVYAIALGADRQDQPGLIGKSGTSVAPEKTVLDKAFEEVAAKVDSRAKSYYLLSYCSPSRAGRHILRIEAFTRNAPNEGEVAGSMKAEFDATGFAPGCDPNTPPSFDVARTETAAAPPSEKDAQDKAKADTDSKKKGDEKKEEKKEEHRPTHAPPPRAYTPPPAAAPAPAPPPPPKPAQPDFNP